MGNKNVPGLHFDLKLFPDRLTGSIYCDIEQCMDSVGDALDNVLFKDLGTVRFNVFEKSHTHKDCNSISIVLLNIFVETVHFLMN